MSFARAPRPGSAAPASGKAATLRDPFAGPADLSVMAHGVAAARLPTYGGHNPKLDYAAARPESGVAASRAALAANTAPVPVGGARRPASATLVAPHATGGYVPAAELRETQQARAAAAQQRNAPRPTAAERLEARLPHVARAETRPTQHLLHYDDGEPVSTGAAAAAAAARVAAAAARPLTRGGDHGNFLAEVAGPTTSARARVAAAATRAPDAADNHLLAYPDDGAAVASLRRHPAPAYVPSGLLTYEETAPSAVRALAATRPPPKVLGPYSDDNDPVREPPPRGKSTGLLTFTGGDDGDGDGGGAFARAGKRRPAATIAAAVTTTAPPFRLDDDPDPSFRPGTAATCPPPFGLDDDPRDEHARVNFGGGRRIPPAVAAARPPPFRLDDDPVDENARVNFGGGRRIMPATVTRTPAPFRLDSERGKRH